MGDAAVRALIYARCSTAQQDYSRQLAELERDAERMGWTVCDRVGSYVSGGANDWDLWRLTRGASRHEFDVLMVWELSRLSRRGPGPILTLVTQFERWGVRVWSHTETWLNADGPARDLLVAIFAWVAKWEREMISRRTKSGMASRRALGVHLGRPKGSKDKRPRKRPAHRDGFGALSA
ncbi:MAG TPA: recombinase family protein [Thermoplasmata archaeon]|nr:recombinase family protein [Thermoplasmata archaeon]